MKRRGFLKLLGGGTAVALVGASTPFGLLKSIPLKDLHIRYTKVYDGVYDKVYHRYDWSNGSTIFGVDIEESKDPEILFGNQEVALNVLFERINKEGFDMFESVPLELLRGQSIESEYMKVPEQITSKYN